MKRTVARVITMTACTRLTSNVHRKPLTRFVVFPTWMPIAWASRRMRGLNIENMQAADGHFYYRKYPLMTAKAPMIHWGQATMFKALAELLNQLNLTKG